MSLKYAVFEKNGQEYYIETNLPLDYEYPNEDELKLHLKALDMAVFSFKQSKNPGWDETTKDAAFFHALKVHDDVKYLYSGLKWFFWIKLLKELGFEFVKVIDETEFNNTAWRMFPLKDLR